MLTDTSKKVRRNKILSTTGIGRNKILSTIGIGIFIYYLYSNYESPEARIRKMANIFDKGNIDKNDMPIPEKLIKRENLENTLIQILQNSSRGNCFLIVGEHDTGKTTLVRNTILKLKEPKGVVHFECPSERNDFVPELAKLLD